MNDVQRYLSAKELEFTQSGSEYILKNCPFCQDTSYHLYLSCEQGLYHCKKCASSGNFRKFQNLLGDVEGVSTLKSNRDKVILTEEYIQELNDNLLCNSSALNYLISRGINMESIASFKIGYENGWIVIPHFRAGEVANIKFRRIDLKEFKRVPNCPSVLFNADNLDRSLDYAIVVEGEFDCIKGVQDGIKNVVATTVGAETFPYEWVAQLESFKKIYVCFDSDKVGQNGANKAAEKIGLNKCINVVLPAKDLNDYLNLSTLKDFEKILAESKPFQVNEITGIEEYIDKFDEYILNRKDINGIALGYSKLDEAMKGLQNEDLIIVSGASTVGKTTFLLNCLVTMLRNGKSVLCFFLEGRPMFFIERLITIEAGKEITDIPVDEMNEIKSRIRNYKLYFYSGNQGLLATKGVVDKTNQCKLVYDIDTVILDHLHKIIERSKDNYSQMVGKAVSDLKNLAVDSKLPVIVVSHIRKFQEADAIPTMQDLRDSSFIHQDSDVILMLWTNRDNSAIKDNVIIKILKNKTGADNLEIFYTFDRPSGRFVELDNDMSVTEE